MSPSAESTEHQDGCPSSGRQPWTVPARESVAWHLAWAGLKHALSARGAAASLDDYMLMHEQGGIAAFKHRDTREYLHVDALGQEVDARTRENAVSG